MAPLRVIAVDWSGAIEGERRKIVLAEAGPHGLVRVESGRTRDQIAEHLIEIHRAGEPAVVGLDFAFSLPAWYLRARGCRTVSELWKAMAEGEAESILRARPSDPPYWGRPGSRKPVEIEHFRRTEMGSGGKSVFQIGGAGAVGTGSLRGMATLHRLHAAGVAIWPFADPGPGVSVVEIYPRLLTGAVNKSNATARDAYVERFTNGELNGLGASVTASEDAFDAAVSAVVMWQYREQLLGLRRTRDETVQLEGFIWHPSCDAAAEPGLRGP